MVVLDAPETLNAITRETLVALAAAFRALGEDASVRAVVVTGAGRRAFTTGARERRLLRSGLSV